MAIIYIKLEKRSSTVYFQSIIGTYSHIAWTRTENPEEGIITIFVTDDTHNEAENILAGLKNEVEFEEVDKD